MGWDWLPDFSKAPWEGVEEHLPDFSKAPWEDRLPDFSKAPWEAEGVSKDGAVTRFTAKIPVVGLGTAAVQAAAGNTEHAKRDLALQANGVLTTAGAVGGFLVGGPLGAVGGAVLGSTMGIRAEHDIAEAWIDDPDVKKTVGDISLRRYVVDGALAGATAPIGGGAGGGVASNILKEGAKETVKQVGKDAIKTGVTTGLGSAAKELVNNPPKGDIDTQPGEKPKPRLVTMTQDGRARALEDALDHFATFMHHRDQLRAWLTAPERNWAGGDPAEMANNMRGATAGIRTGALWATANEYFELARQSFMQQVEQREHTLYALYEAEVTAGRQQPAYLVAVKAAFLRVAEAMAELMVAMSQDV